jgi:hypothetical protein
MGQPRRSRITYGVVIVIVIALGLASRRFTSNLPAFVGDYAGDTLWALMVYLLLAFVWPSASSARLAAAALAFAFAIELTQLYHAPWIDRVRDTRLGALVLGYDFVWSDLLCYATGVAMGVGFDRVFRFRAMRSK